jgi:ribosomal protein S18 acetylase RimI-like enzyme
LILVAIFDVCLLNNILEIYNENFPNDISSNKIYKFCIDKDYKILYLEKENKILGGLIFTQLNKEHIYIEYLFVDKKCQSNGIGKKLLNRFINDYKDYIISLHCEDFLIPYYEKFNFNKKDGKYYFKDKIFNLMVIDYNESKLKIINSDIIVELLNNSVWCK